MRKLTIFTFLTLDGVMQAPGTPEEDPSGGFAFGGWSVNYWDDDMRQAIDEVLSSPFDLLLGRKTYEILASYWPYAGDNPTARVLNRATKYLASSTLSELPWNNSRLITGDLAAEIADLKNQEGPELQVQGSGQLIQTLLAHDLIDEYRLWIFPLVVGHGKRLFGAGCMPAGMTLGDTKTSSSGVMMNTYQRAGALQTGSFALEQTPEAELERRRRMAHENDA